MENTIVSQNNNQVTELETVDQRKKRYSRLCLENEWINFTPMGGVCSCNRNIFNHYDGRSFISGCPYCHRSFCE